MKATTLETAGDVSSLPSVTFGPRSLMWWGTMGFIVIEGWTTALLIGAYFYLRQNYSSWPPLRTPDPSLMIPSINLAIFLISCIPARMADGAAKRLDEAAVKRWLVIMCIVATPTLALRWFELWAINTRWDTNAYGSAAWTIVAFHTSLLLLDIGDTVGLTIFYFVKRMPVKTFSDTADNTFYWYFTVGIWIPIYLIVYVGPRIF
jgi:heme/copper-type cytochrome/quinol oxidase subunit 3